MNPPSTPLARLGEHIQARPETLLVVLIAWHLLFWALVPIATYAMLPLDSLELLGWGMEWQGGYYKHPPLGPWLGEIAYLAAGNRVEALYLLAQLGLALTLLYTWLTARELLGRTEAVLATVLLAGGYFHTFLTPNFNMNTLQLPIWAALGYHFLRGWRGDRRHWPLFGALCGLALLAKYSGLLLIASCAMLLLSSSHGRQRLVADRGPIALGGALCLLVLLPHLAWMAEHWRLPLEYLAGFDDRDARGAWAHVANPLRFALVGLATPLFGYALFALVADRRAGTRAPLDRDTLALLVLLLGPLLLSMAFGVATGSRLKSTWAFPFFSFIGIALFRLWPTRLTPARLGGFAVGLALTMLLMGGLHVAYKTQTERSKTAFAGERLAAAVDAAWQAQTDAPLRVVVGDHILSAIVSQYGRDRPSMLVRGDFRISTWLDEADLERGAVAVCDAGQACFPQWGPYLPPQRVDVDGREFDLHLRLPR